jgi:hypothetical protein
MQDAGCRIQDADLTGAFSGTPVRSSVSGLRPWRHEGVKGDATFPRPGRGPKAGHRTQSRVPGTGDPRPGTGSTPRAGYRDPRTESEYRKRAHRAGI